MKESLHKSIAEIMTFFDFDKLAEIEKNFFNMNCDNEEDNLVDVIKEFALETLYECAKDFENKKEVCWRETKYNLCFYYIYDDENPRMELKYIPVHWGAW